jgi:hypothetical protein
MTAHTLTYHNRQPSMILPIIIITIILALFTLPAMKESAHANLHAEAAAIRQAYDAGCLAQRWVKLDLKSGLQRDHCLVTLPDGRIGDRIAQFCKRTGWLETTAFIIGDGSLAEAVAYLAKKACERVY